MPDREYPAELQRFFYSSCDRSTLLGITKEIQCCSFLPAKKTYISPKALCGPLSARSLKRDWGKVPNLYLFERYIANAMEGHREFMIADDLPLKMSQSGTISTYIFYFCVFLSAFVISANQALPLCFRRNHIFSIANHLHERHDINKHKLGKNNLPKLDE